MLSDISWLDRGAVGLPALVVSRLDPRGRQSLDGVVLQESTILWLETEHLAGRIVEGPGEAGSIVGTGLGTLLPVRDRGLRGERGSVRVWDY